MKASGSRDVAFVASCRPRTGATGRDGTWAEPTLLWLHAAVSALVVMRNESRVKLGALATPYARSAVRWQTALAKKMETGSRRSMAQRAWPGWLGPSAALQQMKKLTSSPLNDESCEQASEKSGQAAIAQQIDGHAWQPATVHCLWGRSKHHAGKGALPRA